MGVRGEAVFIRIFDLGGPLDPKEALRALGTAELPPVAKRRPVPEYVSFATPIPLDTQSLDLGLESSGPQPVTLTARLYPVGALSTMIRFRIQEEHLRDLNRFPALPLKLQGQEVSRIQAAQRVFNQFASRLAGAYEEVFDAPTEPETYTAFCLTETPLEADSLFQAERATIASLLVGDPRPEKLSRSQIQRLTGLRFSYYRDDLVILDWDAAFVIEPAGRYEDLLYVFEVANLELLLLRKYDTYLDRVLNQGYDDYERLLKGNPFFQHGARDILARLGAVRMDLAEVTDELENVAKFFGDYYLARIFLGLSKRLHLNDYRRTVEEKLHTLNGLYRTIVDFLESRQNLFLEWAIVLLIVFEIVMAFVRH